MVVISVVLADLVILAVDTLEIAIGKEYITYPVWAGYHRLLSHVIAYR